MFMNAYRATFGVACALVTIACITGGLVMTGDAIRDKITNKKDDKKEEEK